MSSLRSLAVCPCRVREQSDLAYESCCGRWHKGFLSSVFPDTAEQLMRSRYCAYALAKKNDSQGHDLLRYLLGTWLSATAPGEIEISPMVWSGLEVLHSETDGDVAIVEFLAYYKENGKALRMHERSRFIRQEGRWFYIDGED
jgi:SEC-C motif domain protein